MIWLIRDREIAFNKILLMGILNVTPDSFSDGGAFIDQTSALEKAARMIEEGADILDLGAESTRPGAQAVDQEEELRRLLPVLRELVKRFPVPISIDTTKPEVARICLEEGAHVINDVSGLRDSGERMAEIASRRRAGLILMHRRGNPETMQSLAEYDDLIEEISAELRESIQFALRAGVQSEQIVVDPGLGFAKNAAQNLEIIAQLEKFHKLGRPILLGPSRKSFIGQVTGRPVSERLAGTLAVAAIAAMKNVHILRVHEIAPVLDAVRMAESVREANHVRTFQMGHD